MGIHPFQGAPAPSLRASAPGAARSVGSGSRFDTALAATSTTASSGPAGHVSSVVSAAISSAFGQGGAVSSQYASNAAPQAGGAAGASGAGGTATFQADLDALKSENLKLLRMQMEISRGRTSFISNVLKIRHDTVKNTIQNLR